MILLQRVQLFLINCSFGSAYFRTIPVTCKLPAQGILHGKRSVALESSRSQSNEETTTAKDSLKIVIRTPDDMLELGAFFASLVFLHRKDNGQKLSAAGRTIFLEGDLGAGKTVFSRGFIRFATANVDEKITSPTYLLSNTYQTVGSTCPTSNSLLYHMDLYRLDKAKSNGFAALNLEDVFRESVSLVEWSSRLPDCLIPSDRIEFKFSIRGSKDESKQFDLTTLDDYAEREAVITPYGFFWECAMQEIKEGGYLEDILI